MTATATPAVPRRADPELGGIKPVLGGEARPTILLSGPQLFQISVFWFALNAIWGAFEIFQQKRVVAQEPVVQCRKERNDRKDETDRRRAEAARPAGRPGGGSGECSLDRGPTEPGPAGCVSAGSRAIPLRIASA